MAGHVDAEQSYTWLDSERQNAAQALSAATTSQKEVLLINASSEHAEVSIDGNLVGTVPLEIKLDPGSHTVVVEKRGFQRWTREVRVIDGAKQSLWAELEQVPSGQTEAGQKSNKK
jgi:hypothetical protein